MAAALAGPGMAVGSEILLMALGQSRDSSSSADRRCVSTPAPSLGETERCLPRGPTPFGLLHTKQHIPMESGPGKTLPSWR